MLLYVVILLLVLLYSPDSCSIGYNPFPCVWISGEGRGKKGKGQKNASERDHF